ncbi:putative efflux protein, MATE family [Lachnospiraceae bacterium XBB2008]|nr:putative efflux protein, MATE family [Lachnospiraceae bacterium XBB2008]
MTQYEKMTGSPVEKLIVSLSIPTIISMLISNIYNIADTAFVGRLGTSASGAVGIVFGFMAMIQAIGFLFGQGSGSLISRMLGAKDNAHADETGSTGLFYSFFFGLCLTVFGLIFIDPIITFLGSTPTIAPFAKSYLRFILCAAPFMTTSYTLNNLLRYEGKAFFGMIAMLSGAVLNIALDPVLMFGFGMGVAGAGLSTALSQFIGWCIMLSMFVRGKSELRLSIRKISFSMALLGNIAATGLPSMIRQGLNSACTILMNSTARPYGDAAIAAMSIVTRVSFFTFSMSLGIGQGFQPVSGFNFGAGKFTRVRKGYRFGLIVSQICMTLFASVVFIFAPNITAALRDDPYVIVIGTRAMRLMAASQLFMPVTVMTEMLLQTTGKKLHASVLSAMKSGVILIPALLILSHFRGLYGIEEAQPVSLVLSVIPTIIFARSFFKELPTTDDPDPTSEQTP